MDNQNQEQLKTISFTVPNISEVHKKRSTIPVTFGLAIVCFFFTFCDFKCVSNGTRFYPVTGIDIIKSSDFHSQDFYTGSVKQKDEMPGRMWAAISLLAAIIGLAVFGFKDKRENIIGFSSGTAGVASLIIFQYVLKSGMKTNSGGQVEAILQSGYWGALLSLGVAGVLCYLRLKNNQIISSPDTFSPPNPNQLDANSVTLSETSESRATQPDYGKEATKTINGAADWLTTNINSLLVIVGGVLGLAVLVVAVKFILNIEPNNDKALVTDKKEEVVITRQPVQNPEPTPATVVPMPKPEPPPTEPIVDETIAFKGHVKTKHGSVLNMHPVMKVNSETICQIPDNTPIGIIKFNDYYSVVDGDSGKWCKIKYNDQVGWVWGNYIRVEE